MTQVNYCWTLNNYDEDNLPIITDKMKYMVYGKEVAPTTGTRHLQGFTVFHKKVVLSTAIKLLPPGCHVTRCTGTAVQNMEYCKKDGDFVEQGSPPGVPGKNKRDWSSIREAAKKGRYEEIPDDVMFMMEPKVMAAREYDLSDTETQHLWYYGAAGTGKSRKAREDNPEAYIKMCNKWWDGYRGEEVVIIEDFGLKHDVLNHHLKIWADRYYFPAEIKGGTVKIRPKQIIVTSNYHPSDIWSDYEGELKPILRRFKCVRFQKLGESPKLSLAYPKPYSDDFDPISPLTLPFDV